MKLREQILKEHSKRNCVRVVNWIDNDPKRFAELMDLFMNGEKVLVQRASHMVSEAVLANHDLVKPWIKKLVVYLEQPKLDTAVSRNITRIFQFIRIPRNLQGRVVDCCFRILKDKNEKIAAQAFSMTVLVNISKENPELKNEIRLVIEDMIPYGSPGIKNRGNKMLKELS